MNTANPFSDMADDLDFVVSNKPRVAEVTYFEQTCPKCNGTGRFTFGYVNVRSGECFACKGKGKMSFKTSPATRAKAKASA
jgi:DnaJ-class molecular chaperone